MTAPSPLCRLHVLVVSLVFPPDSVSTAQIVGDLVADLGGSGVTVTVLTTIPHYNPSEDVSSLRRWFGRLVQRSDWAGASVYHCAMPRKGASVLARLASWLWFHLASTVIGVLVRRPVHVIFAPSPPLTIGLSAWILGLVHRAPYVYNVQELYPDIAVAVGALRPGIFLRMALWIERFVYARAAVVTAIADRMAERLRAKGVPEERVVVIPNFVDVEHLRPAPKDNAFSREMGLAGRFVVTYAGNLGPAQGLDFVLDAAALLVDETRIRFLVIGEGIAREQLQRRIAAELLINCRLLPYQPYSRMLEIYAASDLSLVPQAQDIGSDAIPSKVYRIMACGRPVVALTTGESDLARLIEESGGGLIVSSRNPADLAATIRTALHEPQRLGVMGDAGRRHVLTRFERHVVTRKYRDLFEDLSRR